jgi:hypothetical protein
MVEAEEERVNREKFVLASVKSLVADMVKTKRLQAKSNKVDSRLLEATTETDANDRSEPTDSEASHLNSAGDLLESMLSDEKAVALETFFTIMGALIQQESVKPETMNHRLKNSANLERDLRKLGISKGNTSILTSWSWN